MTENENELNEMKQRVSDMAKGLLATPRDTLAKESYAVLVCSRVADVMDLPTLLAKALFLSVEQTVAQGRKKSETEQELEQYKSAVSLQNVWVMEILTAAAHIMREIDPQVAARLSAEAEMRLVADVCWKAKSDGTR